MRPTKPCILCGVPIRWEPAECSDCRGGFIQHLRARDAAPRKQRPRQYRQRVDRALILAALARGLSYNATAVECGCSYTLVHRVAVQNGVARGRGAHWKERRAA